MVQPKNLVAAFVFVGLLAAGNTANADGVDSSFYIEVGALTADPDNVSTEFTIDNLDAVWDLDRMTGAKAQIGGDFGFIRTDLKVRAMRGDISSITGSPGSGTITEDDAILAVGTLNIYGEVDIDVSDMFSITPYIGIGTGYSHGFLRADAPTTDGRGTRRDLRHDGGHATVGMIGALFEVADTVGLTAEYERMDTGISGHNNVDSFSLGLRLSF